MDFATGFSFFFFSSFLGSGAGAGFAGSSVSSPNKSSYTAFLISAFGASTVYYFLPLPYLPFSAFSAFYPPFFPPLKASWASLGKSAGPTYLLAPATAKYQLKVWEYFFLWPYPNITPKTTETLLARERSAIDNESPTKNFFSDKCFSTKARNLFTSSISLPKSIFSPFWCLGIPRTAGSKSQAVMSSH